MMVCSEAAADESLAAIRARSKLGIAMAAMIRMMATTISSSISEKPFCLPWVMFWSFRRQPRSLEIRTLLFVALAVPIWRFFEPAVDHRNPRLSQLEQQGFAFGGCSEERCAANRQS